MNAEGQIMVDRTRWNPGSGGGVAGNVGSQ